MRRLPALALVLAAVPAAAPAADRPTQDAPCDQARGEAVVRSFASALSRGDVNGAMRRIARPAAPSITDVRAPWFHWFAVGERVGTGGRHFVAYDDRVFSGAVPRRGLVVRNAPVTRSGGLGGLASYLRARARQHERLRLVELRGQARDGVYQGPVYLHRRADDLSPRRAGAWNTFGKLALDCASGRIFVWAVGTEVRR